MIIMKNLINRSLVLFTLCAAFVVVSCTELEDTSYTDIIASNFIPTSEDVGALIGPAYGSWRAVLWSGNRSYVTFQEESADGFVRARKPYGFYDGGIHQIIHFHTWTSEEQCHGNIWRTAYQGINNCNRVLFQIESDQIPLEPGPERDAIIAELRVLRASFYYVLIDVFGNIPIVERYDVPEGFLPEQNTRLEVFNFIVNEITESIPFLTEDSNLDTYARFNNKWSAYSLLARVYLNAEVWTAPISDVGEPQKYGTPMWEEVISVCDEIINSGHFSLEPVQKNCFLEQNQSSNELIWTVPYDEMLGWGGSPLLVLTLPHQSSQTYNLRATGWGGLISIPQFINSFDKMDRRYLDGWIRGQVYSSTGEPLKVNTGNLAGEPMIIVNELPGIDSTEEVHSYRIGKWEIPMGSHPIFMNHDWPVVRYSNILMMKAEALMRLNKPGAGELVTEVRMRNFEDPSLAVVTDEELKGDSNYSYGVRDFRMGTTYQDDPILYGRFLDELGWEFAFEGHRRQDMIRFGVYNTKSRLSFQGHPDGSWDYKNIGPIPLSVINTNPNLTQNPGY
jgi:starch-binding outer membrane protein, SusD/RagB family